MKVHCLFLLLITCLCRIHNLPVGVPAEVAAGQRVLPQVYQVDQQREGSVQAG